MITFNLYRFGHDDGFAKEWAYADLGNGMAMIRWGPANQLRSKQEKPLALAQQRARQKMRMGYQHLGRVTLNADGIRVSPAAMPVPSVKTAQPRCDTKPAVDLSTLLGSENDGFYF
ncbi:MULTISPECIES: hypothetical protein [unclassified Thiocapsa]|uniref:hypothetical protein n=1 Tax=unclassified Thiocapsa TaxID=2641286 RepID=UPI0035AE5CD2